MWDITPADKLIIKSTRIVISDKPAPIGGMPDGLGSDIPLQFPVKLLSDNKSANWTTTDIASYEPLVIFSGANARSISIELTYVITGGVWTGSKISGIEKMIRSYFYRTMENSVESTPVIEIYTLYGAVGDNQKTTWRAKDVDVQHADGIVIDRATGRPYNLTSKITIGLDSYTQMATADRGGPPEEPQVEAEKSFTDKIGGLFGPDDPPPKAATPAAEKPSAGNAVQIQTNLSPNVESFWY